MDQMAARVRYGIAAYGQRAVARAAGMSLRDVGKASKCGATLQAKVIVRLDRRLGKWPNIAGLARERHDGYPMDTNHGA